MAALEWAAPNVLVLLALTVIILPQTAAKAATIMEGSETTVNEINDVLNAVEKLVHYFKGNVDTLNLDGFFGLRVLEGHLQLLIQEQKAGHHKSVPPSVWERIVGISKSAESVSEIGKDFVRKDDSKYFEDFSQVVEKPWAVLKQPRKLDPSLRWEIPQYKAKVNVRLTEDLSDRCMKEVMNASYSSVCVITDECAKIMTTRGLTGYGITHQLLWSILGEMSSSCDLPLKAIMTKHSMLSVHNLQLEMCTNNFYEMIAIVHVLMKGKVDESHQDLFLEQQFVCPSLGFYEFLKKDYLRQILKWQFPSGCFGEVVHESEEDYPDDEKNTELDVGHLLEHYHKYKDNDKMSKGDEFAAYVSLKNIDVSNVNDVHKSNLKSNQVPNSKALRNEKNLQFSPSLIALRNDLKKFPVKPKPYAFNTNISYQPNLRNKNKLKNVVNVHSDTAARLNLSADVINKKNNVPNVVNFVMKTNHSEIANQGIGFFPGESPRKGVNQRAKTGRKLLVEKQLEGGCLSHKTGVGAGALVIYLHYLIKPGNIKWTGHHDLYLSDTRNLLEAETKAAHFQDMHSIDAAIADKNEDEGEEEDEDALDEIEDEDDEDEDIEDEDDDETAANYNEDDGWEVPSELVRLRNRNRENQENSVEETDQGEDIIINKDGNQQVVDYANLDDQDVGVKIDEKPEKIEKKEDEGHYYYDDENELGKDIIKRRLPITARPYPPARVRRKHKDNGNVMYSHEGEEEILTVNTPNVSLLVLVSITPLFLILLFLIKFFRTRRVHMRCNPLLYF